MMIKIVDAGNREIESEKEREAIVGIGPQKGRRRVVRNGEMVDVV